MRWNFASSQNDHIGVGHRNGQFRFKFQVQVAEDVQAHMNHQNCQPGSPDSNSYNICVRWNVESFDRLGGGVPSLASRLRT